MMKLAVLMMLPAALWAETGSEGWLRYTRTNSAGIPDVVTVLGDAPAIAGTTPTMLASARREIVRGVQGMAGKTLRAESGIPKDGAIVLGTLDAIRKAAPEWRLTATIAPDGYWLKTVSSNGLRYTVVTSSNDRGVLYGAFALLRKIQLAEPIDNLDQREAPYAPVRWVDQWDNLDGSIERGYGGRSIFWDNMHARADLTRAGDYARLLASIGINGCSINNVNANPKLLSPDLIPDVARIADAMRPWGVQISLSIDFGSPQSVGGLDTFDPADPRVAAWWKARTDEIYRAIPDFGGFVLKADSEGRVGPSTYGRTHADAANVVARALKPHGGLIFYRGFVYDHHMDWNNPKNDRARAAYDNFKVLDGKFDDNVIVQIKNGPIDFQVREPASPLFGALEHTNQAIELQVTQEYFGQARHTVFLVPMWKETLDFDMHAKPGSPTPVKALVSGKVFQRPTGGFVGVVNIGFDADWTGNQLSQANLYGYGRLAWNPDLPSKEIDDEWTKLTFGRDPKVLQVVSQIQLSSWRTYENYTGPLGLQTLTDITGNHYGVNVEASERNGWGQWHRADDKGVGMDRTVATGTGYTGQYRPEIARMYESLASVPDDLILFFHHVPYTYVLHSGKTVIQTIYDLHYDGADAVEQYVRDWKSLNGRVDRDRYTEVLAQLEYQAGQAEVWRDAVSNWFLKASNIPDAKGRVGRYPGRTEAEAMTLDGYTVAAVTPAEDASGGKAVSCPSKTCSASFQYDGPAGTYDLRVEYFDQNTGTSHYRAFVGDRLIADWFAELRLPSARLDSTSSTRRLIHGVALRPGDRIRIEGSPDGRESAALDYVEIVLPH
jgi:alpha-glucuronidase